jgi:hypothetical protein
MIWDGCFSNGVFKEVNILLQFCRYIFWLHQKIHCSEWEKCLFCILSYLYDYDLWCDANGYTLETCVQFLIFVVPGTIWMVTTFWTTWLTLVPITPIISFSCWSKRPPWWPSLGNVGLLFAQHTVTPSLKCAADDFSWIFIELPACCCWLCCMFSVVFVYTWCKFMHVRRQLQMHIRLVADVCIAVTMLMDVKPNKRAFK